MTTSSRTRRLLVPLATLVAAGAIAAASGASFTTQTASAGVVTAGTLTQTNSNTVAFKRDNLKPGDTVTGTVTITNSGSLAGTFTLTETQQDNTFVDKTKVRLTVKDRATGTAVVDDKQLGTAGTVSLGQLAAGASRTYDYTVSFLSSATNSEQGKTAATTYVFDSVQLTGEQLVGVQDGTAVTNP